MSSAESLDFPPAAPRTSARLSRRAAALAARLADLLDQALPGPGEHTAASGFLRAMAQAAGPQPWGADDGDPLDRLAAGYGLSPVEIDLLLLAGLPDEHEGYAGVLRTLHPRGEPRPSAGLAAQLFCAGPDERALLREVLEAGPAVAAGVVRLDGDAPFWERTLQPAEALWSALHGVDAWPAALARVDAPGSAAGLDDWLATPSADHALRALASGRPWTVLVTADTDELAAERGAALAAAAGLAALRVSLASPPDAGAERLVSVHATARGAVPVLRLLAPEGPGAAHAPALERHPGPAVVCAQAGNVVVRGERAVVEVPAPRLTTAARQAMWRAVLPEAPDAAPGLAARYTVEPAVAGAAAGDARALAELEGRAPRMEDVGAGVRTRAGLALSSGVRLLRPHAGWDRLVLPPDRKAQLREALGRLQHQARVLDDWGFLEGRPGARGVRMLFCGPSGTGKTLAAEVLAHALGRGPAAGGPVARGVEVDRRDREEPGRGVRRRRARAGGALLRRGRRAVRQAHRGRRRPRPVRQPGDGVPARAARALRGPRRPLHQPRARTSTRRSPAGSSSSSTSSEPGPAERRRALAAATCPPTPRSTPDVDLAELAALYPVVGGVIRNAAVAAAFLAAADGTAITRHHLVRALRREYDKAGRAFPGLPSGMPAP